MHWFFTPAYSIVTCTGQKKSFAFLFSVYLNQRNNVANNVSLFHLAKTKLFFCLTQVKIEYASCFKLQSTNSETKNLILY